MVVVGGSHFERSFYKETYCQLTVDNNDLKRKKLLCIAEVPCLYVVHSIVTRGAATIRVEGTTTSNELVIVQAVQDRTHNRHQDADQAHNLLSRMPGLLTGLH